MLLTKKIKKWMASALHFLTWVLYLFWVALFKSIQRRGLVGTLKLTVMVIKTGGFDELLHDISDLSKADQLTDQNGIEYQSWISQFDTLSDLSRKKMLSNSRLFAKQPLISIIMPVYNTPPEFLRRAVDSVRNQLYENWELCIADDASESVELRQLLTDMEKRDARIKVVFRKENGHISAASNSAIELASGQYMALLDHDDELSEHALFWVLDAINQHPTAKLIYSDEDKIDEQGLRHLPYFKSDWNLDLFLSHNMVCHFAVYDAELIREVGGFRLGYEGSQDYDLTLRCIEKIDSSDIHHIPRVLYHWRSHRGSTALSEEEKPYAICAGEKAIDDYLKRQNMPAKVMQTDFGYRVKFNFPEPVPLVSLIIPTYNRYELLKKCIDSILEKTDYGNYEVIIIDNGSDDKKALKLLHEYALLENIKVIRDDSAFNYSRLNNQAAALAKGELLAFLNNDIEVISPDWLTEMASHAIRPDIGAVGAKLLYPDNTLQHAGIVLGLKGVAGHAHLGLYRSKRGYQNRANLLQSFSAVTGACLVVKKTLFERAGRFNEQDLQITFNDVDLCLKIKQLGYRNIWTPYAELYHLESATRGNDDQDPLKIKRQMRESYYIKKHWEDLINSDPAYNPNLSLHHRGFSFAHNPRIDHVL